MIFLIVYDRSSGRLERFQPFGDSDRRTADDARLEIELDLMRRRLSREVVLLEASTEDQLRRSHRRYFETAAQLSADAATGADGTEEPDR